MNQPIVTAIVSTYGAERFMRGCLDDLVAQTAFNGIEVIIIDSGSPQNESAICMEYARSYPQIKLIRTEREPLYTTWNRAIGMARGKYLTNANTDDRHRHDFMEVMINALNDHPDVALTYTDQFVSHTENETFEQCEMRNAGIRRYPDYSPAEIMLRNITGSQPMWRKSLHDELGFFDTNYLITADYDMWMRFAAKYALLHVPGTLGMIYYSPDTISGTNNMARKNLEILAIQKFYINQNPWQKLREIRKPLAAEIFARGYQHIVHNHDNRAAEPFIREAIRLDPTNLSFLKTYALRCIADINYYN